MTAEDSSAPPSRRVHPVDLLMLALAVVLGMLAYAYLFRRSPVPTPVDPLLGTVITVEFETDRPWKEHFAREGDGVLIEEYLAADVVREVADTPGRGAPGVRRTRRRVDLKVRGRETQRPEAMTLFRTGVRRGTRLSISDDTSEVQAEVIDVAPAPGDS